MKKKIVFTTMISLDLILGISLDNLSQFEGLSDTPATVESQLKTIIWNRADAEYLESEEDEKVAVQNYRSFFYESRHRMKIEFVTSPNFAGAILGRMYVEEED